MAIPRPRPSSDPRWRSIPEFPGYSVSDEGFVRNDETGRWLTGLINQQSILYVGLVKEGVQHKRAVAPMVACAFVPLPTLPYHRETFDTPIHLDGNKLNLHYTNLLWRPRWFAVKYHRQFQRPWRGYPYRIEDADTGERFPATWDAAMKYGLINNDLDRAVRHGERVWPTNQLFVVFEDVDTEVDIHTSQEHRL